MSVAACFLHPWAFSARRKMRHPCWHLWTCTAAASHACNACCCLFLTHLIYCLLAGRCRTRAGTRGSVRLPASSSSSRRQQQQPPGSQAARCEPAACAPGPVQRAAQHEDPQGEPEYKNTIYRLRYQASCLLLASCEQGWCRQKLSLLLVLDKRFSSRWRAAV